MFQIGDRVYFLNYENELGTVIGFRNKEDIADVVWDNGHGNGLFHTYTLTQADPFADWVRQVRAENSDSAI